MRAVDRYRYRSRFNQYIEPSANTAYDRAYSDYLSALFVKAFGASSPPYSGFPQYSSSYDEATITATGRSVDADEDMRRAISPISNYFNTLGMYRSGFSKDDNDTLANNAYFSVAEKAMMDYLSTLKYTVVDDREEVVDDAVEFLRKPNPQDSFPDIIKATLPDLLRYDAAVIAQSFNHKGYAVEMKPYLGTEFWKEIDRSIKTVNAGERTQMFAYYSAGYTKRFWQRSRTGLYVSFQPDEIAYMMMYPKSDSVYGTDFISRLKWQIQYLIDSTRAAGKTFANGVVPSIVWKHPQIFDRNQLRQRMEEVRMENQGSYKFGSILHLVRDEDVVTLSHTLHDMEWLEGQRFVAQIIWAMWGFQPEEFIGQSVNRATAYVGRNITKSKMLYPLVNYYEDVLNRQILPHLEGYKKDWKFKFMIEQDLDDMLKQAQILATQVQAANMMITTGVKPQQAYKIARVVDDPNTLEIEDMRMLMQQGGAGGDMMPKQPVKNKEGAVEGYKGASIKKIPFGDSEERQAGIKK